ncbi:MAG: phosphate propanoyltransferase [Ruminococcaceae bacterium]|nr:phosphate propanoyltransferase [Oscillospiraceae bacterium]
MDQLVDELMGRIFIEIEASGRHVHLTEEASEYFFGHKLTPKRPLSQPGQFLCQERISIVSEKGRFDRVAVLGPERKACQVELSLTDCISLGLSAPVRQSGNLQGASDITLEANGKRLSLEKSVIVAQRHIHMTPQDAKIKNLHDGQRVRLRALTARPTIFEDVIVRVSPNFQTYAHLDYDEANACGYQKGDLGLIV